MAIKESAKQEFLTRQLDNFDWIKKANDVELDNALFELSPIPHFHTKPFKHQKASFLIGVSCPEFLYLLDMGLGKTKLMLDLLFYARQCGLEDRALVQVPNIANIETWIDEIKIHRPDLKCVPLLGQSEERWRYIHDNLSDGEIDGDVFVINYDGFVAMVTDLVQIDTKKKKRKRQINVDKFDEFIGIFNWAIFDESTNFKNHQSLTYKMCNRLGGMVATRFALTGTPFGRDPADLWSQFHVVDRGLTLGYTLGIYRACFFKQKTNYWSGFPEYKFDERKKKQLYKVLKNRSIFYSEDECPDLPKKVYSKRKLTFPMEIEKYYEIVIDEIIKAGKNQRLMKNAYIQMRQLASGFLGVKDDDTGEKSQIVFDENPKLDELAELVQEMPAKAKMVVYHEYIMTGYLISGVLDKLGIGYERLWGGTKDPTGALRRFRETKKCRIFVVNNKSGAFGLNLQVANYVVFFESPDSPIVRRQAEKRCHRTGQKANRVFYFDLVMKNSVDEKILFYLEQGKELFKALVQGKEKWR